MDGDGASWEEIGKALGIPAARAQQIGAKALRKLRRAARKQFRAKFNGKQRPAR